MKKPLFLALLIFSNTPIQAQTIQTTPKNYLCFRAQSPIAIDGKINETAWKSAPWTDEFVDIEGDAKPHPTFKTRAKLLWDDRFLYVAARLEEPNVWATLTKRDSVIFHDNDFEIFIDPDGDNRNYLEWELNALNTLWDLRLEKPYRDGGTGLNEWNTDGIRTAVHVDGTLNDARNRDTGWTVEFAIPFSALAPYSLLPIPPREGNQWRLNFSRVQWDVEIDGKTTKKIANRPEHNWVWSPQGAIDMHRPERWGFLQFCGAPNPKATFKPDESLPTRDFLMAVYYAQRDFQSKNKRFAASFAELGIEVPPHIQAPKLELRDNDFKASARTVQNGLSKRLHVRSDSFLWWE